MSPPGPPAAWRPARTNGLYPDNGKKERIERGERIPPTDRAMVSFRSLTMTSQSSPPWLSKIRADVMLPQALAKVTARTPTLDDPLAASERF